MWKKFFEYQSAKHLPEPFKQLPSFLLSKLHLKNKQGRVFAKVKQQALFKGWKDLIEHIKIGVGTRHCRKDSNLFFSNCSFLCKISTVNSFWRIFLTFAQTILQHDKVSGNFQFEKRKNYNNCFAFRHF